MSTKFKVTYSDDTFNEGDFGIEIRENNLIKATVGFTGHNTSNFRKMTNLKNKVVYDEDISHNKAVIDFLVANSGVLLYTPTGYNDDEKNYLDWVKVEGEGGFRYILKGVMEDKTMEVKRGVDFLITKGNLLFKDNSSEVIIMCNGVKYVRNIRDIKYDPKTGGSFSRTKPFNINIGCIERHNEENGSSEFTNYIGLGIFSYHKNSTPTTSRISGKHELLETFPYVKGGKSNFNCRNGNGIYTATVKRGDTLKIPILREPLGSQKELWDYDYAKFIVQDGYFYVRDIKDGYINHLIGESRNPGTYTAQIYRIKEQNTPKTGYIPYVSGTDYRYRLDNEKPHSKFKIGECKFTVV